MRKIFARRVLFILTIMLLTAFTSQVSAKTTVDELIFGNVDKNIIDILAPQAVVAIQDFETTPATPTLTYTATGGSISTGQNPSTGLPANANLFASGARGYQVVNGTATLNFANQSLAGLTNSFVEFRLAGMSVNNTNGIDTGDTATLAISLDGGTTFSNEVRVVGSAANQRWDFTATGSSTNTYDGDNTVVAVASSSGAAGISTVRLNLPNTATQVQVRITLLNDSTSERWVIDDVRIDGTASTASQPDLTISQSAPVSVANGGTLTYTLNVTNSGSAISGTAFNATFALPASGYTNPQVTSTGCFTGSSISSGVVTFTGCSSLAQGATSTMTVTVTPTTNGTLTSGTATVDTTSAITESNEGNNTASGVSTNVFTPSPVVINEVYGGGNNSGAPYNADFIELYNSGSTAFNLNGYSLQYSGAPFGGYSGVIVLPNASIPAGGYFLVQTTAAGTANGVALPAPNYVSPTDVNLSATNGNVILVNGTTALGATCPASTDTSVIDRVAYGTGTCREGATSAPAGSNTTSISRTSPGLDTNTNSADFAASTPSPTAGTLPTPALSINDVTLNEGNTGTTSFAFTVSLSSAAPAGGVTFDIATADSTANSGSDYAAQTLTTQTIPAGTSSYTFTVLVNGDTTVESDETFFVNITNVTGATVSDSQGVGTITNDDTAPANTAPTISNMPDTTGTVGTPQTVNFTVSDAETLTGATVTATSSNTAVAPNPIVNYTSGSTSGSLTINPASAGTTTITVRVTDSGGLFSEDTFVLTVSAPAPAGTIAFSSATNTGAEASGTATLTVSRTGGSNGAISATVSYTDGSAVSGASCTAGVDYIQNTTAVSFADGDTTDKTITVTICNDAIDDDAETFTVTLGGASASGQTTTNVTITDDDTAPNVDLSITETASPNPVAVGSPLTFTLTVTNTGTDNATNVAVDFQLPTGTATYTFTSASDTSGSGFTASAVDNSTVPGTIHFTGGTVNGNAAPAANAPAATATLQVVITPTSTGTLTSDAGDAVVDPANAIVETDETNNSTLSATTVTVTNAPTAAMVTVGGRVVNSRGRGISRAAIKMTDGAGNVRIAYTSSFGYYRFADVEVGQTLIFEIKRKGYNFTQPTQVVSLTEEDTSINFTAF